MPKRGKGDCVFVVLADGEPLLTRRMRGNEPPEEIQLPIAGREQVTLVVEPGEGLDLADHADWCDARLIKNASSRHIRENRWKVRLCGIVNRTWPHVLLLRRCAR